MIKKLLSPRYCNMIVALLGVFWLSVLGAFAYLTSYDLTAGSSGTQPLVWPQSSSLRLALDRSTAVLFLHPRCPCSLATSNELAKILNKAGNKLQVYAVVVPTEPVTTSGSVESGAGAQLSNADSDSLLIKNIDAIPGVTRISDPAARQARLFGAETSGDVLLYSASGKLLFAGGITSARGHEGDNVGADALIAAAHDARRATVVHTPVFGCSLTERTL